jgi:phage tail sheath protein FI
MAEAFTPGVEVLERDAIPGIQAPGSSFSGIIVETQRGPDDRVTLVSDIDQFKTRYGGAIVSGYGYETAKDYFDEGGVGLYVIRATGETATPADNAAAATDILATASPSPRRRLLRLWQPLLPLVTLLSK